MQQTAHPALLALIGYDEPAGLLVLEFMARGSLEEMNQAVYRGGEPPQ
jgi:hypothetical protein